jgi:hypothetical protein
MTTDGGEGGGEGDGGLGFGLRPLRIRVMPLLTTPPHA